MFRTTLARGPAIGLILTLSGVLTAPTLLAHEDDDHRQLGAHVHGIGHLNLAIDEGAVEIELIIPAFDIVGFEHVPRTEEQHQAVAAAVTLLRDGERLFDLPSAADCRLRHVEIPTGLGDADAEHRHDHGYGHAHGDHEGTTTSDDASVHSDVVVHYLFACAEPAAIDRLDVNLFTPFPSLEGLRVQYVTAAGQGAGDLTPARNRLSF
ncbi:DUF2796 domain-containing protein [Thioalkalicoccus limnaeus]|uniref:DUF2796 domain-containing protein n=1 Tax=Thioalkalicoccus limnaeus TaxID=120681 RepID=A0ABV4BDM2_9GAMM